MKAFSQHTLRGVAVAALLALAGFGAYRVLGAGGAAPSTAGSSLLRQPAANGNGLVGWWKLDGDATDATGNHNDGALNGFTPSGLGGWKAGKFGNGLFFSATDFTNYVSIPNSTSLDITSPGLSFGGWMYPKSVGSYQTLLSKALSGSGARQYALFLAPTTNQLWLSLSSATGGLNNPYTLSTKWNLNAWNHFFVTYNGTTIRVYVNGVLAYSSAASGSISNSGGPISIGSERINAGLGNQSNALIDDVRIYSRALSQSEITQIYQGSQPAAYDQFTKTYLKMDETGGKSAANAVGQTANINPGTLTNFTFDGTTNGWVAGNSGNALLFDGSSDYVQVPDATSLRPTGDFTLSAWVKNGGSGASAETIMSKWQIGSINGGNASYSFALTATSPPTLALSYSYNGGNYNTITGAIPISGTGWYHVAFTYTYASGAGKLYVNGVADTQASSGVSFYNGTSPVRIGASFTNNAPVTFFNGSIDDVRYYNAALTAAEITALYGGTAPAAEASYAAGYWNLNEISGTVAHDASWSGGNLQNFALSGTDGWTSGTFGNGLLFKQANTDYVSLPDQGLTRGSVEFWLNPATITGDQRLFSQDSGATTQAGTLAMNQSSGESGSLWVWDGAAWQRLSDSGSLAAGSWNHVVVDYSGSSATAFVNGTQAPYVATTRFDFSGVGVSLGGKSFGSGGSTYSGAMDDVRVSSAILPDYQVADRYRKGL